MFSLQHIGEARSSLDERHPQAAAQHRTEGTRKGLTQEGFLKGLSMNVEAGVAGRGCGAPCGCLPFHAVSTPVILLVSLVTTASLNGNHR